MRRSGYFRRFRECFWLLLVFMLISGVAIFLYPLMDPEGEWLNRSAMIFIPAMFVGGLIGEIIFLFMLNDCRLVLNGRQKGKGGVVGMFRFFRCKEAVIADLGLFTAIGALVMVFVMQIRQKDVIVLVAGILYIALNIHGILNGKNYEMLRTLDEKEQMEKENVRES